MSMDLTYRIQRIEVLAPEVARRLLEQGIELGLLAVLLSLQVEKQDPAG